MFETIISSLPIESGFWLDLANLFVAIFKFLGW
jgi:hypothetical protein